MRAPSPSVALPSVDQQPESPSSAPETATPACPKCGGEMWDNRESKRNPRAPDFKCRDKGCEGVIWPPRDPNAAPPAPAGTADDPACPICGGKMWDDRTSKRNPRAPDFKCRNKPKFQGGPGCEGVIWPPRDGEQRAGGAPSGGASVAPPPRRAPAPSAPPPSMSDGPPFDDFPGGHPDDDDDDLPF